MSAYRTTTPELGQKAGNEGEVKEVEEQDLRSKLTAGRSYSDLSVPILLSAEEMYGLRRERGRSSSEI